MKEEKQVLGKNEPKERKSAGKRLQLTFSILVLSVLFVVELYLMINLPKNYLALGIIGLIMLCFIYLITDLSFKLQNEKTEQSIKEQEKIYKAQKVSYIFMKQSHMDLEKLLTGIKQNSDIPAEELIDAQKAIGKVTIQRNKENIKAVINANDELMNRMVHLEDMVKELAAEMREPQIVPEESSGQQEVLVALEHTQTSMKDEMNGFKVYFETQMDSLRESIAAKQEADAKAQEKLVEAISMLPDEIVLKEEPAAERKEAAVEALAAEEAAQPEETPAAEEITQLGETPSAEEMVQSHVEPIAEEIMEQPEIQLTVKETVQPEEAPVAEETVQLGETPSVEETAQLEEEPAAEGTAQPVEMPVAEEMVQSRVEPMVEEIMEQPEIQLTVEETVQPEEAPAVEETAQPEETPVAEETAQPEEEPAFEGKTMTPEEIAMMLGDGEPDSGKKKRAVKKTKPQMPDFSNPGHMMTPEEIASLLEGM